MTRKAPPPPPPRRSFAPLLIVAAVVAAVAVGIVAFERRSQPGAEPQTAAAAAPQPAIPEPPPQAPAGPPANAKFGPHKQASLPPLPFVGAPPARPIETVRAAYKFAAEHPEVLGYVPCYCGCERSGHRGNDDCFVTARDAHGDVTAWEPHGMTWAICLDVARDAMQMYATGASVAEIRAANERKWKPNFPNQTPTPKPAVRQ